MNTNHNQLRSMNNNNTCEASASTITLRPEEEFNPQYCIQCDQTLWSIELMRNHLDLSGRHPVLPYMQTGIPEQQLLKSEFQSSSALKIHLEQLARHHRDYEEGDRERCPEGWEDKLARRQREEENREDPVTLEKVAHCDLEF
ncbi:hypothetical protein EDD18DRAFT_1112261 [Armillaria luteobubalina]|uniref:Uncharacterized protein n=1 Tax=Armillaria luteobubalina TaxID=153913 RepID=A0AA39PGG3_9AGAR|nr:hypothetical protein EDD18DRAFT_1112261 [Armillaria luteobubalina]